MRILQEVHLNSEEGSDSPQEDQQHQLLQIRHSHNHLRVQKARLLQIDVTHLLARPSHPKPLWKFDRSRQMIVLLVFHSNHKKVGVIITWLRPPCCASLRCLDACLSCPLLIFFPWASFGRCWRGDLSRVFGCVVWSLCRLWLRLSSDCLFLD